MSDPRQSLPSEAALVLGSYLVLGALGAVLWWLLAEPAYFTVAPGGGLGMGEVQLARRFDADGWFVVLAAVLGLLSGGGMTWWRAARPLVTVFLLVLGSGVATLTMVLLGRLLGPPDPDRVAATADVGSRVATQLEVTSAVGYLVWPIGVLAGALLVLWSPPPGPTA